MLHNIYRQLTGDCFSSTDTHDAKIDSRMKQLIEMDDPNIVVDLHNLNEGRCLLE